MLYKTAKLDDAQYSLLIASDGDGDRNMILGSGLYVSPGDSLALIARHSKHIPSLKNKLTGVARSMPTSRAVDLVCHKKGYQIHETPTGWKYFCDLLENNNIQLCGEESFGTGSYHSREKDGIWAGLCWLSLLASKQKSVKTIVHEHWKKYGRHYYQRHDFTDLTKKQAKSILKVLDEKTDKDKKKLSYQNKASSDIGYFTYQNSDANTYGYRVVFSDTARFIVRFSGTDTTGVTLRLYLEQYEASNIFEDSDIILAPLFELASRWLNLEAATQKSRADVII